MTKISTAQILYDQMRFNQVLRANLIIYLALAFIFTTIVILLP
jgi:hypothetical protein